MELADVSLRQTHSFNLSKIGNCIMQETLLNSDIDHNIEVHDYYREEDTGELVFYYDYTYVRAYVSKSEFEGILEDWIDDQYLVFTQDEADKILKLEKISAQIEIDGVLEEVDLQIEWI